MKGYLLAGVVLIAGCAMPGRVALVDGSSAWSKTVNVRSEAFAQCLIKELDNEPWSAMGLRAPANRIDRTPKRITLASVADADVWLWEVVITPKGDQSEIEALARENAGGPYVARGYLKEKLSKVMASCS